jgi:hypothetical protein
MSQAKRNLQLMAIDGPDMRIGKSGDESIIAVAFQTVEFGTQETIAIEVAMLPERAAILLRLLEELRDRGAVPNAPPGILSRHRHGGH